MSARQAPSDHDRARTLASLIGHTGEERLTVVTIPGNPPTKARPRVGRGGHVYHDPKAVAAENRTAGFIRSSMRRGRFTGNVAIACLFFRADFQRQDVDNMLKHVCDAANGVAWDDDSQVTAMLGVAELDPNNPRTILVLTPHHSTLRRGSDDVIPCPACASPIERRARRKYCSADCATRARRNREGNGHARS